MSAQNTHAPGESREPITITSILNPPYTEPSPRLPTRHVLEPPSYWFEPRPSGIISHSPPRYASSREESPCLSSASSGSAWGSMQPARPSSTDSTSQYSPSTSPGEDVAYPYHTTQKPNHPCTCSSCKSTRHAAHANAHARYSADMARLMTESGQCPIGSSAASAERFAAYFASLAPVDDGGSGSATSPTATTSEGYHSGSSKPSSTSQQLKKDAHKIKEKSRRDTVKSFILSFSSMVPSALEPCTSHRFSKNNVEEPANVTVLDRAALYLTAQRLVLDELVRERRLTAEEVETRTLRALPDAGRFVQRALGRSEQYVGELRWHGIQNPSFELAAPAVSKRGSHTGAAKRRRRD